METLQSIVTVGRIVNYVLSDGQVRPLHWPVASSVHKTPAKRDDLVVASAGVSE